MTEDQLRIYVIECIDHIRYGEDLTDAEFLAVCKAIGSMPAEALLAIAEADDEPEEIARKLQRGGD
jgi:hypothetical protein